MQLYIYDDNLTQIGLIDEYRSLIWADRYAKNGDCEVFLPANDYVIDLLQTGRYIAREGSTMICIISKIELTTDAESGDYLIVSGTDAKSLIDRRIIWDTMTNSGSVETFARRLVDISLGGNASAERKMRKANGGQLVCLDTAAGLTETDTEQVSYKNLGEKIREYCQTYGWGYRMRKDGTALKFGLYAGEDRSDVVVFSERYENLASSDYIEDATHQGNTTLVAGEGEGVDRATDVYSIGGTATGVRRYEFFTDAKDLKSTMTYSNLQEAYPGGSITQEPDYYVYSVPSFDFQIFTDAQLAQIRSIYPAGVLITTDTGRIFRAPNVKIAAISTGEPRDTESCHLMKLIYRTMLLQRGYEKAAEYGIKTTFNGAIIPEVTFAYNTDYFLGDIVRIENRYGLTKKVRITEITEVHDESGYSINPAFEEIAEV